MTTYPNAAPPRSALFDDAPAAQPVPQPAHTTPATRIAKDRAGQWYPLDVAMQYGAPVPLALALRRVAIGRTVFVQPEDAETVLDAVRGTDSGADG